jgi:hypothetical protein
MMMMVIIMSRLVYSAPQHFFAGLALGGLVATIGATL